MTDAGTFVLCTNMISVQSLHSPAGASGGGSSSVGGFCGGGFFDDHAAVVDFWTRWWRALTPRGVPCARRRGLRD